MVSLLSHKKSYFRFIRHCLFGGRSYKLRSSPRIYIGTFVVFAIHNDIPQALSNTHTYLYANDTSIFCQHKDVTEIENVLNKEFANVCDCFVDNKLSIHFGEDKTKCILFSRDKNIPELNITYNSRKTSYRCYYYTIIFITIVIIVIIIIFLFIIIINIVITTSTTIITFQIIIFTINFKFSISRYGL